MKRLPACSIDEFARAFGIRNDATDGLDFLSPSPHRRKTAPTVERGSPPCDGQARSAFLRQSDVVVCVKFCKIAGP